MFLPFACALNSSIAAAAAAACLSLICNSIKSSEISRNDSICLVGVWNPRVTEARNERSIENLLSKSKHTPSVYMISGQVLIHR